MKVFVTGGTSGIGLELARRYVNDGHTVAVSGRSLSKLEGDALLQEERFSTYEGDVKDGPFMHQSLEHFCQQAGERGLDLVVANAGRSIGDKSFDPDFEAGRDVVETNVMGLMNTFAPAVEIMRAQGRGHLVAISSVAGFIGLPTAPFYSASKAAVTRLCEGLSIGLKPQGIQVSCICPGFIDTPLTQKNNHKMPFLISAPRAADRICQAIEKKYPLYVFPLPMKVVITFLDKIPRWLYRYFMGTKAFQYQKRGK